MSISPSTLLQYCSDRIPHDRTELKQSVSLLKAQLQAKEELRKPRTCYSPSCSFTKQIHGKFEKMAFLAHVEIIQENDFYYQQEHPLPTIEQFMANQTKSEYPICLFVDVTRAFANILGRLTQASDRPHVEHDENYNFASSMQINVLTMNHGNLTKNPKINDQEVKDTPMKDTHHQDASLQFPTSDCLATTRVTMFTKGRSKIRWN